MNIWRRLVKGTNRSGTEKGIVSMAKKFFPEMGKIEKLAFLCTLVGVFLTHLYMFTNEIVNHDDVNRLLVGDTDEVKIQHGRWAAVIFDHISGSSAGIPYINGVISTLAISCACVVLVSILKVQKKGTTVMVCMLLSTFPVVANIFLYIYIADVYFISMFLAMWGAWLLLQKGKPQKIAGILFLTLACGCYQAFWCMGIAVLFLFYVLEFLEGRDNLKKLLRRVAITIVMTGMSLVLYLFINKIVQKATGFGATSYQGLDSMGGFKSAFALAKTMLVAYYEFFCFFYKKGFFVQSSIMVIINILLTCLTLGIMIKKGKEEKRSSGYWCVLAAIVCGIPLVFNLISVASQNATHILMQYSFVMPYLMCVMLVDRFAEKRETGGEKRFAYGPVFAGMLVSLVIYKGYITDNEIYFRQQLNYEATYSYTLRMLYRIEEFEGYTPDMKIALINETPQRSDHITIMMENYPDEMAYFDYLNDMVGTEPHTFVKRANDVADFCRHFHGYDMQLAETEDFAAVAQTKQFAQMATYPGEGSMQIINDILVIKLPDGK